MSLGQLVRKIIGPGFYVIAKFYRAIFVNLDAVALKMPNMPPGSHILDIGGGDGALLNHLFKFRQDIFITMIDTAENIGGAIEEKYKNRVAVFPKTSLAKYLSMKQRPTDFVLISDVMHHIPVPARESFLADLKAVTEPHTTVIIKDVEPGHFRAQLGYWADKYISGDKTVSLIRQEELKQAMLKHFSNFSSVETGLFKIDKPNYCLAFSKRAS